MTTDPTLLRRVELVDGGWVVDSGERKPTLSGGLSIVWKAALKREATVVGQESR